MPYKDIQPDLSGRTVIITGANVGVGYEAAIKLVNCGASRVILVVRSLDRGQAAKIAIENVTGRTNVIEVWLLDMLDYSSIKAFATRATNQLECLDYAILNAGVVMASSDQSKYGFETTIQVNTISTVLLAILLLPKLKASKTESFTPVLEIISSILHEKGDIKPSVEESAKILPGCNIAARYFGAEQYRMSKLLLMFALQPLAELARSKETSHPDVFVTAVCPGPTRSNLGRDLKAWYYRIAMWLFERIVQHSTEEGAREYVSGLMLGEEGHGRFWARDTIRQPAKALTGERGQRLSTRIWDEIVEALKEQNPKVEKLARKN